MDRRQIPAEEHALAAAFGEHYAHYTRRVRRWI
jgi:protein-S-isoprenylcysteine O-methyltransferase Ste14